VAESDNLVALQEQIRGCDGILGKMESLLGGFQSDLGKISSEARRKQRARRQQRTHGAHCAACAAHRSSRCKSSPSR
jgi:radical SAM protein with 4Fe4S-binding SPASM domain